MVSWKTGKQEWREHMTARETLDRIRNCLKEAGIEEFEYESWIILEWIFGIRRADYYMEPGGMVNPEKEEFLTEVLEKRSRRVPLQYLMGSCEFMGYPFIVDERVLIPRQDTECLVEKALELLRDSQQKGKETPEVLDLCTGSGCIGISIKKLCKKVRMTLADISEGALEIAGRNADALNAEVSLVQSDLFKNIEGNFDYIISNPPYIPTKVIKGLMPEVRDYEPHLALDGAADGLFFYRKIVEEASVRLNVGGVLLFEIGQEQGADLKEIMEKQGFTQIEIWKDLAGLDRIAMGRR